MDILSIVITFFIVIESLNILILYFSPGTKLGNGIGVFNAFEASKSTPKTHDFIRYLINWVAGTKLIFVALLIVVLFFGDETLKVYGVIALILSILSFYWRLFPIIKKLDNENQITPKGYSKILNYMIISFLVVFIVALLVYYFL